VSQPLSPAVRFRALLAAAVLPPLLSLVSLQRLALYLGRPHEGGRRFDDSALAAWVDGLLYRLPGPWRRTCPVPGAPWSSA
jgi:hypothetical protein